MIHIGINPRALWEAYTENLNPQVVNRKTVLRKKRENGLIGAFPAVKFSSVAQLCPTLCDPMDCSMPGLPIHHQLLEFTQTHVH